MSISHKFATPLEKEYYRQKLASFYANTKEKDETPKKTKREIFRNMEFVRDINMECFNPDGKELDLDSNDHVTIKTHLIHLDFDNLEK